ncbi:MAG: hypothetical protein IGS49_19295 [Chlorogloeopsis fritschii C42_A2020_084]|uniref:hypothetical protein n=1 Tax=Chlorogloeopsis fritschii TaxID=1124 RepID=UPI001A06542A|nr:hypothetical protein [Chlorogloeopsis fritschii]MBF2007539.1 hypothetical protein [Chlorogloeopsis fritschii C42_A2020_084]
MSTLEQIEAAILTLPSDEFKQLRQWFFDLDYQRWDEQLEQDIADGKLEALAEEAIADFKAGAVEKFDALHNAKILEVL